MAFHDEARSAGIYAESINGDAFSDELKAETIAKIKADLGKVDLVVYSLASPRRTDPETGVTFSSTLKPVGKPVTRKTLDTNKNEVKDISLEPASDQEIADTIKVMGGEDWERWINALADADVLEQGCKTVALQPCSRTSASASALIQRCLLYTSPSPRDLSTSRMPSSA